MSTTKAVLRLHDMPADMLDFAINTAAYAQEQCTTEKEVAHQIKTEFDQTYEPTWHCVVGRHFGSYVTHEKLKYCYFYIGQMGVLIFKTP